MPTGRRTQATHRLGHAADGRLSGVAASLRGKADAVRCHSGQGPRRMRMAVPAPTWRALCNALARLHSSRREAGSSPGVRPFLFASLGRLPSSARSLPAASAG